MKKIIILLICILFFSTIIYAENNNIFQIVASGNIDELKKAIENGVDVNATKDAIVYGQKAGSYTLSLKKETGEEYFKGTITILMYVSANNNNPALIKLLIIRIEK